MLYIKKTFFKKKADCIWGKRQNTPQEPWPIILFLKTFETNIA